LLREPPFSGDFEISGSASRFLFHIAEPAAWEHAAERGAYAPPSLADEGFIHCSTREQVADTANRFYGGRSELILLRIDSTLLDQSPRSEQSAAPVDESEAGTAFPHLYGPLPLAAVTGSVRWPPGEDGTFRFPAAYEGNDD
jgi:uncharacterized protein (DUF952 family)